MPSSPIAPAHKRARSVNVRASPPDATGNFEDEVDSGSEPPSPHPTEREEEKSGNSSLTAHSCSGSTDKRVTLRAPQPAASKGVILVSEAFTEINARLVIVLASGHHSPLLESELETQMNSLLLAAKPTLTMLKVTSQPPCHLVTLKLPFLVVCWITTARHHHSRCAAGWCQCLEPTEIFFLECRTMARFLHEQKQKNTICTRTATGAKMRANHTKQKQHTNQPDDPQIPQTCVLPTETTNQTHKRGRSPNKNTHKKDLPKDTVV